MMAIFRGRKKYLFLIAVVLIILSYPPLTFKPFPNPNPLPDSWLKGIFHVHSDFSDGRGSINDITRAVGLNSLDFIILTDHGEPNLKCATSTSFLNNVLLIGGSEFSLDSGHLAAAGFRVEKFRFPREPQEAIDDVNRDGGITFISHPFDKKIPWTDFDISGFTGIEVMSAYSSARRISVTRLAAFPLRYLLNKKYSLLTTLDYPEKNFSKWDSLNRKGNFLGIFALDTHAKIPLTKKISIPLPSYESSFGIMNIYVKTGGETSSDPQALAGIILENIKKGRFFNAVEGISPANGFDMIFRTADGTKHEMGARIPYRNGVFLISLPFGFPLHVKMIRDGELLHSRKVSGIPLLELESGGPGVYRCEIFTDKGRFGIIPWIVSNPFFLRNEPSAAVEERSGIIQTIPLCRDLRSFHPEKNPASSAELTINNPADGTPSITFQFNLKKEPGKKDFWVAAALRKKTDLSGYRGIHFESRSSETMRYRVEIRSGDQGDEKWYRHSFLSGTGWTAAYIPFEDLRQIYGIIESGMTGLDNITSFFISINGSMITSNGFGGTLEIRNLSVYK